MNADITKKQTPNSNITFWKICQKIGGFLSPIIYAFVWLFFLHLATRWLPQKIIANDLFLALYSTVFLFTLISKSTSWSIGHDKFGIKGDSRAKVINYHHGDFWFDLFADNPELLKDKEVQKFINSLISQSKKEKRK